MLSLNNRKILENLCLQMKHITKENRSLKLTLFIQFSSSSDSLQGVQLHVVFFSCQNNVLLDFFQVQNPQGLPFQCRVLKIVSCLSPDFSDMLLLLPLSCLSSFLTASTLFFCPRRRSVCTQWLWVCFLFLFCFSFEEGHAKKFLKSTLWTTVECLFAKLHVWNW